MPAEPNAAPPAGEFASVSTGEIHTCGVTTGGEATAGAGNDDGQAAPSLMKVALVRIEQNVMMATLDCFMARCLDSEWRLM